MKRDLELNGAPAAVQATEQEMWLLGQAPLRKYLDFVEDLGIGTTLNRVPLVQEWGAAAAYMEELERREAGIADNLECLPLGPELAPLAEQLMRSSRFTRTFNRLPARIEMVELAHLLVCQNHVTRSFVDRIKQRLGPDPDPVALFNFCLPPEEGQAKVEIRSIGSHRYVFRSDSTDFRFHEPVLLEPHQLGDYAAFGAVAGALGLVVGYSCNFLNAVRDDDSGRLLLHNGYHRSCAMLELGITHAPCVVQTVTSRDELDLVAKPVVANDPGYFFNGPRPPLLKDFADPRLRKVLDVRKVSHVIELSFEVRDYFIED